MKAGTKVVFIKNNKLKEGVILRNEKNIVVVKSKNWQYMVIYRLLPSQIAKKEEK